MRVHQQPAFVLVNRAYSETSWIVEVFSQDYGRLAVMAKGARRIKSRLKGVLMPFQPLLLSWVGKGEIPTLTSAELNQEQFNLIDNGLKKDALVCGFYCNELIVNLLHRHDPHPALFKHYQSSIISLSSVNKVSDKTSKLSTILREFEQVTIKETGYGVSFQLQADGKSKIVDDHYYRFEQGHGFVACHASQPNAVLGRIIYAMHMIKHQQSAISGLSSLEIARGKHLMRDILNQTLGYKKIISRELFLPKTVPVTK